MKNGGGLWKLNDNAQSIFIHCEKYLKSLVISNISVDSKLLLCKILEECSVIDDFKYICALGAVQKVRNTKKWNF